MLIQGKLTYLALMEKTEASTVQAWMNEPELRRLAWTECPLPVDLDQAGRWIEAMNRDPRTRLLAIRRLDSGESIGFTTLRNLSWLSRSMRFGNLIWPPSLWNQGLGTDARRAMLEYAFGQLGMRRVYGGFAAYNAASRRSHEKLGAEVTATLREAVYVDGRFHDAHYYVYRRESFPGPWAAGGDDRPCPAADHRRRVQPASLAKRTYQDYHGYPLDGSAEESWRRGKPGCLCAAGRAVLLAEEIRRSAEVLFFPRKPAALPADLIRRAVDSGFAGLNLHRLEACLPSGAAFWGQSLQAEGFREEGRLDQVIYADGSYHDLVFYGLIRE